jgi:putative endonuclease
VRLGRSPTEFLQGAIAIGTLFVFAPSAILTLDPRASFAMLARARMTEGALPWRARPKMTGGVQMRVVKPAVYILASKRNGTLYVGVTGDLAARVSVHQQELTESFTQRYAVHLVVHYEYFETMVDAITREKQLKKFSRARKLALIEANNPNWRDLTPDIMAWRS